MIGKIILTGLLFLFVDTTLVAQYNFDSVRICHKEGQLAHLGVGEYEIRFQNGELIQVSSKDSLVKYNAEKKQFTINNIQKSSFLEFKLTDEGILISTKDTSFVLTSPQSIGLARSNEQLEKEVLFSIGVFSFLVDFSNGRVSKISIGASSKFFVANIYRIKNIYTWDIGIESKNQSNMILLKYIYNRPYLFSVNDDSNKIGIRLLAKKKDGFFNLLEGGRIYGNSFDVDNFYVLKYTKSYKLKKGNSKFDLSCKY